MSHSGMAAHLRRLLYDAQQRHGIAHEMSEMRPAEVTSHSAHPVAIRIMHWIGAYAILCMILSGWQIYDASPILPFVFPRWMTLGGWLGGAIAWHLFAMWLLVLDGLCYLAYGLISGHFRSELLPVGPRAVARDLVAALRFRLVHTLGHYNAVQRLLYLGAMALGVLMVVSGLAIWKPVQLSWLTALLGGYPAARVVHFILMGLMVAFLVVHVVLVALFPRTLLSMTIGLPRRPDAEVRL